jgi:hypothetical protein
VEVAVATEFLLAQLVVLEVVVALRGWPFLLVGLVPLGREIVVALASLMQQ